MGHGYDGDNSFAVTLILSDKDNCAGAILQTFIEPFTRFVMPEICV